MDTVDQKVALTLRHLNHQVREIGALQKQLNSIIDPALATYVRVATLKKQTLVLIADNAAVATHIKLIGPAILDGFSAHKPGLNITAIQCKVKKPIHDGVPSTPRAAHLSDTATTHIQAIAPNIKNERLRLALEKLARQ